MRFLFFPSGGEWVLIILAILLLFGSDKMPEFFRTFTKGMKEFRKATDDIKREFNEASMGIREEVNQQKKLIENEIDSYKDIVDAEVIGDFENYGDEDFDLPVEEGPNIEALATPDVVSENVSKKTSEEASEAEPKKEE